jgi:phosphatidylinositol glycan class M
MAGKFGIFLFFTAAIVVRLALIAFADYVDKNSSTNKYTDVDYEVFSDAATHVYNGGGSPYARSTYRYTPLAAYICLVNNCIHPLACKVVFLVFDILMGIVYWRLVSS